jgi:hypothetical protein
LHNLNVNWHISSEEELNFVQLLLERFLKAELNNLKFWINGQKSLSREELQRSLHIILDCINGAASALPLWKGDNIVL